MRILLLHAEHFTYETLKKAIKNPPDPPGKGECSNCLVVMTSVEEGDSQLIVDEAASSIIDVLDKIKAEKVMLYPYAHLSSRLASPQVAIEVLRALEKTLAGKGVNVARAPFGWYKRFKLEVYGHPLSELSREIRGDPIYYVKDGRRMPLREAVKAGLIPGGIESPVISDKELEEIASRLGISPLTGTGSIMISNIIEKLAGPDYIRATIGSSSTSHAPKLNGVQALARLLESCRESRRGTAILGHPDPVIAVAGSVDKVLDSIYGFKSLDSIPIGGEGLYTPGIDDSGGIVKLYRFRSGSVAPIAASIGETTCIGPATILLSAIIDNELRKREEDDSYVPMIPPEIHFAQVAIIPVSSAQVEVALRIAERINAAGARVALLDDTRSRLGARIRMAARLWIPIVGVIGDREASEGVVTVRRRWEPGSQEAITFDELVNEASRIAPARPLFRLKV